MVGASVAGIKIEGQATQEVVYPLALRVSREHRSTQTGVEEGVGEEGVVGCGAE